MKQLITWKIIHYEQLRNVGHESINKSFTNGSKFMIISIDLLTNVFTFGLLSSFLSCCQRHSVFLTLWRKDHHFLNCQTELRLRHQHHRCECSEFSDLHYGTVRYSAVHSAGAWCEQVQVGEA